MHLLFMFIKVMFLVENNQHLRPVAPFTHMG